MITATITNVVREGIGVRVFYTMSTGDDRSRIFTMSDDVDSIKLAIRSDCEEVQDAMEKANSLSTELQGITI